MALILFFSIVIFDQMFKGIISSFMQQGDSIPVIDSVLHITFIHNSGAAFGIFANAQFFFIVAALVILFLFAFYHKTLRQEPPCFYYGSVSLIGGTVGNLIDRIHLGAVIDFIDFRVWPIFNLADIAIVCGVILMIYSMCFDSEDHANG